MMIDYSLANQKTYDRVAEEYAETRKKEWRMWEEIFSIFNFQFSIFEYLKVLDLGCGSGRLLDYLERDFKGKFEYVGVDYAKKMIRVAKKRHPEDENVKFQIAQIGFKSMSKFKAKSFDLVTMIASYHHVFRRVERVDLLKGIKRILKPGGSLLITVWVINREYFGDTTDPGSKEGKQSPGSKIKRIDFQGKPRYYILLGKKQLERELSEVFDEVEVRFDKKKQNLIAVAC